MQGRRTRNKELEYEVKPRHTDPCDVTAKSQNKRNLGSMQVVFFEIIFFY